MAIDALTIRNNLPRHRPRLTADQVWDRLVEAAETLRRLPDPRRAPNGFRPHWPDVVRVAVESYGSDQARVRLPAPSPAAIDRLESAIHWLTWIEGDLQRLVWLRANGVPWWKLELRMWRLRDERRRYERTTLRGYVESALVRIAARLCTGGSGYPLSPETSA